jgi:murein L,D-transpeptidase YafK
LRLSLRPFFSALLASAAISAALVLGGCDTDSVAPSGRANAPLSDKMTAELESKQMDKGSPVLMRIFKEESEAEIWKQTRNGEFALLKTYPICRWSGELGPKVKEGDRQAPEGFYTITPGLMNPNSNYYLAFNTGFPNSFDRAWGRTGAHLMVHGDCSSRGCYAMTDEQMVEIYALARESFFGGQRSFQLQAYPFRMTAKNMARHRNSPHLAFWKNLKQGYDHFEVTKHEPKVDVCERRYVFNASSTDNASRPLSFSASGKCPAYEVPPEIAQLVAERQSKDQAEAAQLASLVAAAPVKRGVDGGMNPVFLAQMQTATADNDGRVTAGQVTTIHTPGALPRAGNNPPAVTVPPQPVRVAEAEPVTVPSASAPTQSRGIAGLLGNMFSTSNDNAQPVSPAPLPPARTASSRTAVAAAKPAQPGPTLAAASQQTASAPLGAPKLRPQISDQTAVAVASPKTQAPAQAEPQLRTAFTTPASSPQPGLLTGAQPVMPAGSFENRWSAFR